MQYNTVRKYRRAASDTSDVRALECVCALEGMCDPVEYAALLEAAHLFMNESQRLTKRYEQGVAARDFE